MVNTVPLLGLLHAFTVLLAVSVGAIIGAAAGLPIRHRMIRKWSKHGSRASS
jgi:hypothetical protein